MHICTQLNGIDIQALRVSFRLPITRVIRDGRNQDGYDRKGG